MGACSRRIASRCSQHEAGTERASRLISPHAGLTRRSRSGEHCANLTRRPGKPGHDADSPARSSEHRDAEPAPPAAEAAPFDPAAAGWEPYRDEGFIGLVGPFWTRPSGDSHLYAFMAEPKHHNRRGVVQGGMLMTFADRSMGMTCWYANERQPQATVQLDMHFIDAVQIGEFVEAKCRSCAGRARWCS